MSPFKTLFLSTILASGLAASGAASATVLFQNLPDLTGNQIGSCRYNTTCGPSLLGSTYYGAQRFTLTQAATATSAGFNSVVVDGVFASGVNWLILAANGTGGLPGATLFSGTNTAVTHAVGPVGNLRPTTDYSFGFTPASLAAGSYYLAVQAITTNFSDGLSKGVADSGAAQICTHKRVHGCASKVSLARGAARGAGPPTGGATHVDNLAGSRHGQLVQGFKATHGVPSSQPGPLALRYLARLSYTAPSAGSPRRRH